MELFTVGYEGRTLPQLVRLLEEHGIGRLVDVRERPYSRRKGFSATPLSEALRKAGIVYEPGFGLGNPDDIRSMWKRGELDVGKRKYRAFLRNGRRERVEYVVALADLGPVALLCLEGDAGDCHRSVIAEEAVRLDPRVTVRHL
jgi:uncharacterized protein (DUF488 family)